MPPPEPTPAQSSLPEAVSRFGAQVLADAAARARDITAVTGGPPSVPSAATDAPEVDAPAVAVPAPAVPPASGDVERLLREVLIPLATAPSTR